MHVLWKCLKRRQKGINSNNNCVSHRASPICGHPGQTINLVHSGKVIIWCPFTPILFELLVNMFEGICRNGGKFSEKVILCVENLSLPAKYFQLFQ